MQNKASNHRFVVMESLVLMLGGKYKSIDDVIKKLVEVLAVVRILTNLEKRISSCHVSYCDCKVSQQKRCGRKQFPETM